ncbi:hypothetical protein [Rouxiella badensis]|uniref:hypothetical protein n=1 Tax=Rouxiella badensis TaxID=1646377 RepID=UPI001787858C|nr:hypothetical protein [Rouxiella badensis]QOI56239.1 hypothetical protein H2866_03560 [Rouxiella badensis subsp. acadiensis]
MSSNRDDFSPATKRSLADRVGWICSYPNCGQSTLGPDSQSEEDKINNGIAAHICAAAPGGPRYDASMTPEMRKSISNGIWMCRNHGNLVDADHSQYTVEKLIAWKTDAESAAYKRLSQPAQLLTIGYSSRDLNTLKIYCNLFNYEYLQQLKNEPFRAKVPTSIIDPLHTCMNYIGNPSYQFNAADLEKLRQELNAKVLDFNRHFGAESGGNIGYYDYVDLNLIRQRNPSRVEHYVKYIESTQQLAYEISEVALKLLTIQAETGNI